MKKQNLTFLLITILIVLIILAYILVSGEVNLFKGLELLIFALILILGGIALYNTIKKMKQEKQGIPSEDELSSGLKYKAGYYAFLSSMYMWLFIFLLKDKFPDIETMLGGGILLSAFMFYISKVVVKYNLNGK